MSEARKSQLENMILRTAQGDRSAFTALYDTTSPKLHAICMSILKDRPESEETLQDVYIRIWQGADRYDVNGLSPMTWLITIARNSAIDRLRTRSSRPALPTPENAAQTPHALPDPDAGTRLAQERKLLDECIARLDDQQAQAVRAVYLEGMTYSDLAERSNMPISTIRGWLRRSLLDLKDCVSQ